MRGAGESGVDPPAAVGAAAAASASLVVRVAGGWRRWAWVVFFILFCC